MGMAVPFALGIATSSTIFENLQASDPKFKDVSPTSFFVFIGTAMSITAFPVLARILKEGGLIYSKAGALVMGAAALNDAVAWCLLILAISIANAGNMLIAGYVFLSVLCMAIGMMILIQPLFHRLVTYVESTRSHVMRSNLFALTLILVFLSAWTTTLLGLDPIFGSFIFGLIIPRESQLFHDCNEYIEDLVLTFMLPLYFALSGLKTDVTQIHTGNEGAMVILVCFIATIGKFIGCGIPALFSGMTVRESCTIAVLMSKYDCYFTRFK
jgi:Kef-type K+ transport system membrane component KefB